MNQFQDLKEVEKELLGNNPKLREIYSKVNISYEIAQMIKEARLLKGYTQGRLAELLKTKQTSISRVERGKSLPSLSFLVKIAEILNTYIIPPVANSIYMKPISSFAFTRYENAIPDFEFDSQNYMQIGLEASYSGLSQAPLTVEAL